MRKAIFLIILLAALPAAAKTKAHTNVRLYCIAEGDAFQMAASFRDVHQSPKAAFAMIKKTFGQTLPDRAIKTVVNLVYFNDHFIGAGGEPLARQVTTYCIAKSTPQSFKPLK